MTGSDDEAEGRRLLLTAAIGKYDHSPEGAGSWNRPQLAEDVERIADVFHKRMGYTHTVLGGLRLTANELKDALEEHLRDVTPHDYVVVYIAAHAEIQLLGRLGADRYLLLASDADPTRRPRTYIKIPELVDVMVSSEARVRRLLLILDTCYSGAGAAEFLSDAIQQVDEQRSDAERTVGVGVTVISSCLGIQLAKAGAFTKAFREAVLKAWPTRGQTRSVTVEAVMAAMQESQTHEGEKIQPRIFTLWNGGPPEFLRDAHWEERMDLREAIARTDMSADLDGVFLPAAEGFVGRSSALTRLTEWLDTSSDGRPALVSGNIGSGKTAVLGTLLKIADPTLRPELPSNGGGQLVPPKNPIDIVIHLGKRPAGEVIERIAGLRRADIGNPNEEREDRVPLLLRSLPLQDRPLTVLIDAIDEATSPSAVVEQVILPLARGGRGAIRLLLGGRMRALRSVVDLLGRDAVLEIDLDGDYLDDIAMRTLIDRRLKRAAWYAQTDNADRRQIIDELWGLSQGSFIVAKAAADAQAARAEAPDPHDPHWRSSVPRSAGAAMETDLRKYNFSGDVMELLRPLAYAQGRGLPFSNIWPALVEALAPDSRHTDLAQELRTVRDHASSYLREAENGDPYYALAHRALAEHLLVDRDESNDQRSIADALLRMVDRLPDGRLNWAGAHPYLREHLASHAAAGAVIDKLAVDPDFLVNAEPLELLEALSATTSNVARASADAYRRALPRLRSSPERERISNLGLAALQIGADGLAKRVIDGYAPMLAEDPSRHGPGPSWLPLWAAWRPDQPHLTLTGHRHRLIAVHEAVAADGVQLISIDASGATVVWDPSTGKVITEARVPGSGEPRAITFLRLAGRTTVVAADQDGTLWLWDPLDERHATSLGHADDVTALAALAGVEPLVVAASAAGIVTVWNVNHNELAITLSLTQTPVTAIAVAEIDGAAVVAAGDDHGQLALWDLRKKDPSAGVRRRHQSFGILALAFATSDEGTALLAAGKSNQVDILAYPAWECIASIKTSGLQLDYVRTLAVEGRHGPPVMASAGDDRIVRLWDLTSREPSHAPLVGHEARIAVVGWVTVDGTPRVVSGCNDGTVRIWNAEKNPPAEAPFVGHNRLVRCAAVTVVRHAGERVADSANPATPRTLLATAGNDRSVRVWDLATGEPACRALIGHGDWIGGVAFAHLDGQTVVVSAGGDGVRVWDVDTGLAYGAPLIGHIGWVGAVAVAPQDGDVTVITAGRDARVRLWSLRTRQQIGELLDPSDQPLRALVVAGSPESPVVLAGGDGGHVLIWDLKAGGLRGSYDHGGPVRALTVMTLDGVEVVGSAGDDGLIRLWHLVSRVETGVTLRHGPTPVRALATTHLDHRTVVLSAGDDALVRRWDVRTGEAIGEVFDKHHREVRALAVHQDNDGDSGGLAISGGGDGVVHVWRQGSAELVNYARPRHASAVHAVTALEIPLDRSSSELVLISAGADRSIRCWQARTGQAIGDPLLGHKDRVRAVAAKVTSPANALIVSGGDDHTVRVWEWRWGSGVQRTHYTAALSGHRERVGAIALDHRSQDVAYAVSGDNGGVLRRWHLAVETGTLLADGVSGQVRSIAIDLAQDRATVFVGDKGGVHAWDMATGRQSPTQWSAHRTGVSALVTAELAGRQVLLVAADDGRAAVWNRHDGTCIGELPISPGPSARAMAAVGSGPLLGRLRVAIAAGDHIRVGVMSYAAPSVTWDDEVTIGTGSKVLALAWVDHRTLGVGCDMGLLTLQVRDALPELLRRPGGGDHE
ncbi:hypothetical protein [Krasilnikovia sp. M28-CT-15]|uniref:hypothetical protein n=1 Tax=Krasilnikovia sp. M28-CT-15 TaxID=3373540 RepID=UPI003875B95D